MFRARRGEFRLECVAAQHGALELEAEGYAGVVGADMISDDEATPVNVRPTIDDPFGGPGGAGDPFADPLA